MSPSVNCLGENVNVPPLYSVGDLALREVGTVGSGQRNSDATKKLVFILASRKRISKMKINPAWLNSNYTNNGPTYTRATQNATGHTTMSFYPVYHSLVPCRYIV